MSVEGIDLNTTGVLAIWHDVEASPEDTAELFEWYTRQHHVERFDVPGFARARRYQAVEGGPRVFSRYDTLDPGVLGSAAYRERLQNPTEWTQRCMPRYRRMSRTVCGLHARFGRGEGGKLLSVRFEAVPGADGALVDWVVSDAFPAMHAMQGIVGGQMLVADAAFRPAGNAETRLRGADDGYDALIVLVTGTSVAEPKAKTSGKRVTASA